MTSIDLTIIYRPMRLTCRFDFPVFFGTCSHCPLFNRTNSDAQTKCTEHGGKTSVFGIANSRQHFVGGFPREFCLSRNLGDAALRLRHLSQREHDGGLVALREHGLQVCRRFVSILQALDQPIGIGTARRDPLGRLFSSGLCGLRGRFSHVQYPFAAFLCRPHRGGAR